MAAFIFGLDSMPLEILVQADVGVQPGGVVVEVDEGLGPAIEDASPDLLQIRHRPELGEHRFQAIEGGSVGVAHRAEP
jgi:hypothetical protein